jgi:hypothetical protein
MTIKKYGGAEIRLGCSQQLLQQQERVSFFSSFLADFLMDIRSVKNVFDID